MCTEGAAMEEGKAPYTIVFYDFNGNEMDRCGYDGEILYNDLEAITGVGGQPVLYHKDSKLEYQESYDEEMGVAYLDMVAADDDTCTVTLRHDKTFVDMMDTIVEGTWSKDGNAYTLKSDDGDATVTVSEDGKTAVYKGIDGSETNMNVLREASLAVGGSLPFKMSLEGFCDIDTTLTQQ